MLEDENVTEALVLQTNDIAWAGLSLRQFTTIMSSRYWNYFVQCVMYTRNYDTGLSVGMKLLTACDHYRGLYSEKSHESHQALILHFMLSMLDKLDRWEDFVSVFETTHKNTRLAMGEYAGDSYERHLRNGAEPYILERGRSMFRIHFLYGLKHRKAIIERKLAKRVSGQRTGNQYHATKAEFTPEEYARRVEWLLNLVQDPEGHYRQSEQDETLRRKLIETGKHNQAL